MGDLTTLHTNAKRLVFSLKEGLERLESAEVCATRVCEGLGKPRRSHALQGRWIPGLRPLPVHACECIFKNKLIDIHMRTCMDTRAIIQIYVHARRC